MSKFIWFLAITAAAVGAFAAPAVAGPISGLTTFVPGTRLINVEANRVLKTGDTMSGNLTVPTLTYAVPKVAFWSFQGRGFIHDTGNGFANCFPDTLAWNGTGASTFRAPVNLPYGVTITGVTYNYWKGNSAADNSTFALNRTSLPATGS